MRPPRLGLSAWARATGHRLGLRRGAAVLMYHRVAEVAFDPWSLCVSPAHFEEHLAALRDWGATVLPLAGLAEAAAAGRLPRRAVAITFDDGYADNLHAAFPALARHAAPATVFVTAEPVLTGREFWWDALEGLLLGETPLPGRISLTLGGGPREWGTASPVALYHEVWAALAERPPEEQAAALDALARQIGRQAGRPGGEPRGTHRPMTPEELAALSTKGRGLVEIGGHTFGHPRLTALSPARQAEQVGRGKSAVEEMTGGRLRSFSYPYGAHNEGSVAAVREAGFKRACTTAGASLRARADRFRLPRIPAPDMDGDALLRRLSTVCA